MGTAGAFVELNGVFMGTAGVGMEGAFMGMDGAFMGTAGVGMDGAFMGMEGAFMGTAGVELNGVFIGTVCVGIDRAFMGMDTNSMRRRAKVLIMYTFPLVDRTSSTSRYTHTVPRIIPCTQYETQPWS